MDSWGAQLCYACLVRAHPSTMYSLSDQSTKKLFRECTNIKISSFEQTQFICVMCYKHCELWKCFKTRCHDNRTIMGVGGEGTETFRYQQQQEQQQTEDPDQVVVKQEPEDYYMDSVEEITVGAAYSLNGAGGEETVETCQAEDDDPLDSKPLKLRGRKKKKRNKRRREEEKGAANLTNGIEESPVASTSSSKLDKSVRDSSTVPSAVPKKKIKVDPNAIRVSTASLDLYMKTYNDFIAWKTETAPRDEIDEEMLLTYFKRISAMYSTSTLTNKLSHVANTMATFHKIKVDGFLRLRQFVRDLRSAHLNGSLPNWTSGDGIS